MQAEDPQLVFVRGVFAFQAVIMGALASPLRIRVIGPMGKRTAEAVYPSREVYIRELRWAGDDALGSQHSLAKVE